MITIIDLSVPHQNLASGPYPPSMTHTGHAEGARRLALRAKVQLADFPDGLALASGQVTASTHAGTHADSPRHYGPVCEGEPARTIDEIPLEWCYGDGVVLDVRHLPPDSEILPADLERALARINYHLRPMDIVLIQTGADKRWNTSQYLSAQSGLGV